MFRKQADDKTMKKLTRAKKRQLKRVLIIAGVASAVSLLVILIFILVIRGISPKFTEQAKEDELDYTLIKVGKPLISEKFLTKNVNSRPGTPSEKAKTAVKKTAEKAAAKKPAVKKEIETTVSVQFSGKSYTTEELVAIAKDVWKYDLKQKASDFQSVELYVKPEENQAYYVINGEHTGSFFI